MSEPNGPGLPWTGAPQGGGASGSGRDVPRSGGPELALVVEAHAASDGPTGEGTGGANQEEGADAELRQEPAAREGLRLRALEVKNWGTFHRTVWRLDLRRGNTLLTGQVGAGKSTLVDGLSILLNAPSKVSFNLAAGADRRERDLRSYVLGAHRNIADELTGGSRPDYLRKPEGTLSIILAVFQASDGRFVTAGIMLRFANQDAAPTWEYLLADRELTIGTDLVGHRDYRALKASLKASGVDLFDVFARYQAALCRRLRLKPAALALFAQTVAMKSVGNLTDFVRSYMLDAPSIDADIKSMLAHYADLTQAHNKVVDARSQLETLEVVRTESQRLDEADARISAANRAARAVPDLVDDVRAGLLAAAIDAATTALPALEARKKALELEAAEVEKQQRDYDVRLRSEGGADLERAAAAARAAKVTLKETLDRVRALAELCQAAGLAVPGGEFAAFRAELAERLAALDVESHEITGRQGEAVAQLRVAKEALGVLDRELQALSARDSNIPGDDAALRERIVQALGLSTVDLPYAGELLSLAEGQSGWEGAVERLTRPFAMSLLVPEEHYQQVARWVDGNHLGRRLVYLRVPTVDRHAARGAHPGTVADKLRARPGTRFTPWLLSEIARRFDHRCVDDVRDLAHHDRAITRNGQVRDGARHEKDDRRQVMDRRTYVLGWDTRPKRAALLDSRPQLAQDVTAAEKVLDRSLAEAKAARERQRACDLLDSNYQDPVAVDVAAARRSADDAASHYSQLQADPEIARLTRLRDSTSDRLIHLAADGEVLVGEIATTRKDLRAHQGALERLRAARDERSRSADGVVAGPDPAGTAAVGAPGDEAVDLRALEVEVEQQLLATAVEGAGGSPSRLEECEGYERALNQRISASLNSLRGQRSKVSNALISAQGRYASRWPAACVDIAVGDEQGRHDLIALYRQIVADDLPRFEKEFRRQLESNAINEIAVFSRKLEHASRGIAARIDTINGALADIDYRPGTYIVLTVEPSKDVFVREFRQQIREITQDSIGGDDTAYSEQRFLRVRALLDRFEGRQDSADEDGRWTRRVTDVRNWHSFAASERRRDEDTVVEHYTDSDGKSGGQKEKLAYTVLAASLAYQYGLAEGNADAFRFVMIDEAFGRGSPESTRFGLELFGRLGLQLLVVTPLQKIHTIEPYVDAVGYVAQPDQRHSHLVSMTVQEFRRKRAEHGTDRGAA